MSQINVTLDKPVGWKFANLIALAVFLVMGVVYVSKTWSPSSYGYVLVDILGYKDSGPSLGKARPILYSAVLPRNDT